MKNSLQVFCCYARKDLNLLHKLKTHLSSLERQDTIHVWYDGDIIPGTEWGSEIQKHLNDAQIILLLISADFIKSDYCYSIEMQRALERHERGETHIIPIILRPVDWNDTPFAKLQALPTDGIPIISPHWHSRDEAFLDVARGIRKVVQGYASSVSDTGIPEQERSASPSQAPPPTTQWSPLEQVAQTLSADPHHIGLPQAVLSHNQEQDAEVEPASRRALVIKDKRAIRKKAGIMASILLVVTILVVTILVPKEGQTPAKIASSSSPVPLTTSPIPSFTHLAFFDPLHDNSKGYDWTTPNEDIEGCVFRGGGYDMWSKGSNYCFPPSSPVFSNFRYQIDMKVIQGHEAGLMFRRGPTDNAGSHLYYFIINITTGQYKLLVDPAFNDLIAQKYGRNRFSDTIKRGLNSTNILAVVADGENFTLYINSSLVDQVHDGSYSSGKIGVVVSSDTDLFSEAVFNNAQVWTE